MAFFESFSPAFNRFVLGNAPVRQIATGFAWTEGPVWFGDANMLLFSDIPGNRILRWTPDNGLSTFRSPSNFANGHTRDRQGRLVSCEHGSRSVTRTEYDGSITVLATHFEGRRLNSPNDVVVRSDGSIWFTDPHYGIQSDYEGHRSQQELPCNVYRLDPDTGELRAVVTCLHCPNGLAFSPDESALHVADTGRMFESDETGIYRFNIDASGKSCTNGSTRPALFHQVPNGLADGFRLDTDGNLWTSAGDGVYCISPAGELLGRLIVPETVSNVCFGGRARHQLFITATTSVYAVALNRSGV